MSDAEKPPEPSIDEILATIRRIISDDEQVGPVAGGPAGMSAGRSNDVKATDAKATDVKTADDDNVLELTEALNEDGTTRRLAPIGGGWAQRPAAAGETPPPAPQVEPQLRLRPSSQPPSSQLRPEPQRRDAPSLRLSLAEQPAGQSSTGQPSTGQPSTGQPSTGQPSTGQNAPHLARDMPLGGGERTLEDIVRDALRPLLQAWLDENLPPVVERLVQAEITRAAREAAGRS